MSPTKKLRILLVGLDLRSRRIARSQIDKHSAWSVIGEAAIGEAADSARAARPDLVVLDAETVPGQVVPLVNQMLSAGHSTRLLLLTSVCSEAEIRASLNAGVTGLLAKSELDTRFVSAVKHTASGERFLSGQLARVVLRRFLDSALEHVGPHPPLGELTPREREIVRLVSLGNGNKQVAAQLGIAVRTAEVHRANAMRKLNLHNLAELVHFAVSSGLIRMPSSGSAFN